MLQRIFKHRINKKTYMSAHKMNKRGLRTLGKRSLFIWIAYQTVKGTLTTIFIWAPMVGWYFFD